MPTQKKADQIQEIVEKIQNAAAVWYIDARGLTVKETQQLRRNVVAAGGEMKVYKNTLAVRALAQHELPTCEEILAGPTAIIFAGEDVARDYTEAAKLYLQAEAQNRLTSSAAKNLIYCYERGFKVLPDLANAKQRIEVLKKYKPSNSLIDLLKSLEE